MRTLTFEQLRINLTAVFDELDEPIEIVKRGRVVGYVVSNLQDNKGTGISEALVVESAPISEKVWSEIPKATKEMYPPQGKEADTWQCQSCGAVHREDE